MAVSDVKGALASFFFVLVTSNLGLEQQQCSLEMRNFPVVGMGCPLPLAYPDTSFATSSSQLLISSFTGVCCFVRRLLNSEVLSCHTHIAHLPFRYNLIFLLRLVRCPKVGENMVWLDISRGRALVWQQDWIDSKPEKCFCQQCHSHCSLAQAQHQSSLFAPWRRTFAKKLTASHRVRGFRFKRLSSVYQEK